MEKRLFIAIILSIAFLIAWGALAPKFFPELAPKPRPATSTDGSTASDEAATDPTAPATPQPSSIPAGAGDQPPSTTAGTATTSATVAAATTPRTVAPVSETSARVVVIDTPDYVARFSNRGAQLTSFQLKRYFRKGTNEPVDLIKERDPRRIDFPFSLETSDRELSLRANSALYQVTDEQSPIARVVRFVWADGAGHSVRKVFTFNNTYAFNFAVEVDAPKGVNSRVVIGPGLRTLDKNEIDDQFTSTGNGVIGFEDEAEVVGREKAPALQVIEPAPKYIGVEDNYFLAVLMPERSGAAVIRAVDMPAREGEEKGRREIYAGVNLSGGVASGSSFFGPKEINVLERHGLDATVRFGFFGWIARILLAALVWLYEATKNYGWAIVVLTIIIKVILYPLQHKSIVSMKKMQKLQPKMNAIKEKYKKAKTDPEQRQKMNVEMMKLYQVEKINPMSGCLPILLQLPILWAFYGLLSHAIELRGADFMLWINDLSAKDPYYVTPILMTLTMFIQQYMTPMTVEPAQRKMFLAMPFIFGWIFKEFPSGLVLYWLVQNILTILQQWIMNRWWKEHPAELAKA